MKLSKTGRNWTSRAPTWRFRFEDSYSGVELYLESRKKSKMAINFFRFFVKFWPGPGVLYKFLWIIQNRICLIVWNTTPKSHLHEWQPGVNKGAICLRRLETCSHVKATCAVTLRPHWYSYQGYMYGDLKTNLVLIARQLKSFIWFLCDFTWFLYDFKWFHLVWYDFYTIVYGF